MDMIRHDDVLVYFHIVIKFAELFQIFIGNSSMIQYNRSRGVEDVAPYGIRGVEDVAPYGWTVRIFAPAAFPGRRGRRPLLDIQKRSNERFERKEF